ncbi:MAG: hypothetical protein M0R80_14320 [Proteobacteria bacterium]|jgi:hypothetical protein|nr:hypothetical protein [Pseudomonadota bacterium]
MTTWKALYGMVWLCFATLFVAVFDPIPHKGHVHAVLGIAVLVLAFRNSAVLARSACPARLKRISASTAKICVFALLTGAALAVPQLEAHKWIVYVIKAFHIFAIGAILAQTASVATAHDVWHERECEPGPPRQG